MGELPSVRDVAESHGRTGLSSHHGTRHHHAEHVDLSEVGGKNIDHVDLIAEKLLRGCAGLNLLERLVEIME